MTNEEKAKEICGEYAISELIPTEEECASYSSAMEMTEWKDQQFKAKIEDLFNRLKNEAYNERVKSGFEIFKHELMKIMEK